MADILMPVPLIEGTPWWVYAGILFAGLHLAAIFFHLTHPLTKLQGQLKRGTIQPRTAAHQLADRAKKTALEAPLEKLRFSRTPPTVTDLLAIIERIRNEC